MSKFIHRHQQVDHISKIRANLKEMKIEVCQLLKKRSKDIVPLILKPKDYLLIDTINQNGSVKQYLKPKKIVKDLNSQKIGHVLEDQRFESLPELDTEKKEKNKIVRQKRIISSRNQLNNRSQIDISCLLPNICYLKLEFDDQNMIDQATIRHQIQERHTSFMHKLPFNPEQQQREKRYHSIDLNQRSFLNEAIKSTNINIGFKTTIRHNYLQNNKTQINKFSKRKNQLPWLQSQLNQEINRVKEIKNRVCQQQVKQQNTLVPISDSKKQHFQGLEDILKTSNDFNQRSSIIQRKQIYSKVNKQLQKRNKEKLPNIPSSGKCEKESCTLQKDKKRERHQPKKISKYELFQPWQNQKELKDNSSVTFQGYMF